MKRLLISIAILIACLSSTYGQDIGESITIHYQDGSVFIGTVDDVNVSTIYLEISTGDIIALDRLKIKRIKSYKDLILLEDGRYHKTKGLFRNISFMFGANEDAASVSIDLMVGKRMTPRWYLGGGIGFSNNMLNAPGVWIEDIGLFDTYAYSRYFLTDKRLRWFVDGKLGMGWATNSSDWNSYKGGFKVQPGIGVVFANKRSAKWSISLNQHIQYASGQNNTFDGFNNQVQFNYKTWFNRTALTFGLNF